METVETLYVRERGKLKQIPIDLLALGEMNEMEGGIKARGV